MQLVDIVRRFVEEGFGRSMKSFYASGSYVEALGDERRTHATLERDDHQWLAYGAGHIDFGLRAQATSERNALRWAARHDDTRSTPDGKTRALIRAFGKELLSEMRKAVLPKQVFELMALFRGANADLQLAILDWIYVAFDDDVLISQEERESRQLYSFADVESLLNHTYNVEQVYPKSVSPLAEADVRPNCLGMAIILAAMCQLGHVPMLFVSTVETENRAMWREYEPVLREYRKVLAMLRALGYEGYPIDRMQGFVDRELSLVSTMRDWGMDFHFSIAVRIRDDRWVHLDPYMRNFSVFPKEAKLDAAYRRLQKYTGVLPGMHELIDLRDWRVGEIEEASDKAEEVFAAVASFPQELNEYPAGLLGFEVAYAENSKSNILSGESMFGTGDHLSNEALAAFMEGVDADTAFTETELEDAADDYRESLVPFDVFFGDDEVVENTESSVHEFVPYAYLRKESDGWEEDIFQYWIDSWFSDSPALDVLVDATSYLQESSHNEDIFWTHGPEVGARQTKLARLLYGDDMLKTVLRVLAGLSKEEATLEEDPLGEMTDAFIFDDKHRKERLLNIFWEFALAGVTLITDAMQKRKRGGRSIAPAAVEVSLPEYNVGLAALNYVRCWTDIEIPATTFLEHSASQMYWHEAVELKSEEEDGTDHATMERAEHFVRKMSCTYPIVDWKLNALHNKRRKAHGKREADQE